MPTYTAHPRLVAAIVNQARNPREAELALTTTLIENSGRLGGRPGDQGRSHGPYQEFDEGRGAGLTPAQRRDPVGSTRRFFEEARRTNQGSTLGEWAYNAQRPADRGLYLRRFSEALPEARRILAEHGGGGGAAHRTLPHSPGGSAAPAGGSGAASPLSIQLPGTSSLAPEATMDLLRWLEESEQQVRQGLTPSDAPLSALRFESKPGPTLNLPGPPQQADHHDHDGHSHGAGGTLPSPGDDETYGYPTGGVDSGRVMLGGVGGNWGGSMPRALQLARLTGITPSSQKRSRRLTASGNVSDHYRGSTTSYAVDLGTSGGANDAAFRKIAAALGVPNHPIGQPLNVTRDGYRYQVLWKSDRGHYDHIHIGVRRV